MTRYLVTLRGLSDRRKAHQMIDAAPFGARVEIKAQRRSLPQNDRFWAMLTDVSTQLAWHGQRLRPEDWKIVFLDALKREARMVPNLAGDGFVALGRSSSDLTKEEMSDCMELIAAFGAQHGVVFDAQEAAA